MKHLLLSILIFGFGISGSLGQTIKSLGYNTTNGQVIANTGTNVLTFIDAVRFGSGDLTIEGQTISGGGGVSLSFEDGALSGGIILDTNSFIDFQGASAATTRTNLGLGATWLTNTDVTNFRTDIGLGQYDQPIFNRVNFSQSSYINANGLYYDGSGMGGGISIGIISGQGVQSVSMGRFDNSFSVFSNSLSFNGSQSWGTNATHVATTRTNLGLGWPALTNTNVTNFRTDIGLGTTNNVIYRRLQMAATMEDNTTNATLNLTASGTNAWPSIRFGVRGGGGELYENMYMYPGQNNVNWVASAGFNWMSGPGPYQGTTWLAISSGGAITAPNATGTASNSIANIGTLDTRYSRVTNGITATNTFVSYNGTNYTTNTVTISNGIITGWTQ